MPSYTIYGSTDDFTVYGQDAAYSTARSTAFAALSQSSTNLTVGQFLDGTPEYQVYQACLSFDTSGVAGAFSSASLNLYDSGTNGGTVIVEAREHAWASYGTGAYVAGASLSGKALFGTSSSWSGVSALYRAITCVLSDISRTSAYKLLLHSQNQRLDVAPTGSEYRVLRSSDQSGTTNDPYLSVETVTGVKRSFGLIIG